MKKQGFTLAEVLITLAIIGVVAAISIPSVVANTQQKEFQTGLRKAVSVLNSAITMNMALDGESPYENANLFGYLMKHMAVIESVSRISDKYYVLAPTGGYARNAAFYTTDGMRFELRAGNGAIVKHTLYESDTVKPCTVGVAGTLNQVASVNCGGCGSYGLHNNPDETTKPPCMIMVDVNGDRKPNPANVNCKNNVCRNVYKFSDPDGTKLKDVFSILITDKQAIPYGIAAQKAMYQAQSKDNR